MTRYSINESEVTNSCECAYLGIIRSDDFNCNAHIISVCLKANRMAAMIIRLFSSRNHNFIIKLFLTFVRPIVEYATPIWNLTELGLYEKIERYKDDSRNIFLNVKGPTMAIGYKYSMLLL